MPKMRGDAGMAAFHKGEERLLLFGGFHTDWSYGQEILEGYVQNVTGIKRDYSYETMDPDREANRYYYDDTWTWLRSSNLWLQHAYKGTVNGTTPLGRRGHTLVIRGVLLLRQWRISLLGGLSESACMAKTVFPADQSDPSPRK